MPKQLYTIAELVKKHGYGIAVRMEGWRPEDYFIVRRHSSVPEGFLGAGFQGHMNNGVADYYEGTDQSWSRVTTEEESEEPTYSRDRFEAALRLMGGFSASIGADLNHLKNLDDWEPEAFAKLCVTLADALIAELVRTEKKL